ncbi:MAG: hypothetical protein QOD75_2681 [Blastocatellia bacterium]|jgi:hypothetical protein|nr:hypothetical protein [Blastocatellia bacterium]
MKRLTLILTLALSLSLLALLSIGCSGSTEVNVNANVKPATTGTPAAAVPAATAPAASTTTANTGVASCDEYLTQVEKCLNNPRVPDAAKAAYKQSQEQNRTAWKQLASSPQGKVAAESACKTALENAKSFLATCK